MFRGNVYKLMLITFMMCSTALLGCSGGGGGGGSSNNTDPEPSIQILPSSFNFGPVTPGNSPAPLYVEIKNNGNRNLDVSNISLIDTTNFALNLDGGSNPCSSTTPTLIPGESCTAEVTFQPLSDLSFSTNLTITSNDPAKSPLNLPLSGSREDISTLNVRINQVEIACPAGIVTAYVSVTDQGGYPVINLTKDDFSITEAGVDLGAPDSSPFVEDDNATISAALVMDYSSTITSYPDKLNDMQEGAVNFVNQLKAEDEAEIIRLSSIVETVQTFTSDKISLVNAINSPWTFRYGSAIFDAGMKAIDDTKASSKDRKAVVLITDGYDNRSDNDVNDLINYALEENIPFFPIGLGDTINIAVLESLADDTGGQYYEAANSDNLQTVYEQLADVLFNHQYILTYNSGLTDGTPADLTVGADLPLPVVSGSDTRSFTSCLVVP